MAFAITKENAVEMQRRSAAAQRARKEAQLKAVADIPLDSEEFRMRRLNRVRAQLERVDRMIERETDPSRLDRLASAVARLNEQERQLSNRSMPPTLKANAIQARPKRSTPLPEPEPE